MSEISMTVGRYHGLTKAHHGVFHQMPDKHDKFIFVTKKHDPEDPRYPLPVEHREKAIKEVAPKNTSVVPPTACGVPHSGVVVEGNMSRSFRDGTVNLAQITRAPPVFD